MMKLCFFIAACLVGASFITVVQHATKEPEPGPAPTYQPNAIFANHDFANVVPPELAKCQPVRTGQPARLDFGGEFSFSHGFLCMAPNQPLPAAHILSLFQKAVASRSSRPITWTQPRSGEFAGRYANASLSGKIRITANQITDRQVRITVECAESAAKP